jgi:Fe2+ transport system protein FeoA
VAVSKKTSSVKASQGRDATFVCPLSKMRVGTSCRIKQLCASPEIAHRLREMGFCEDQRIKLLSQHSNVICQVCNARLGISAELAEAIWVEPLLTEEKVA